MMTAIRLRVGTSIEQGILPRDDQLYQHIFTIIRQALELKGDNPENSTQATTSNNIGIVDGRSSAFIQPSKEFASISDASDQPKFDDVLRGPETEHNQSNHWDLLCDSNISRQKNEETFDPQTDMAVPDPLSPPGDWIESLDDILYQPTDPHPLIASYGQAASDVPPPDVSNYQRELEHDSLDAFVYNDVDSDALLEEDECAPPSFYPDHLDPSNTLDPNNIIDGIDQTLQGEAINDFSFLDTEYHEWRDTEPLQDHGGRNKGLEGRCENNFGDETVC